MEEELKDEQLSEKNREGKNYIKKLLKGILYVIGGFIILNILLFVLLSIPSVQKKVVDFALGKVKEMTKSEMRIDKISLSISSSVNIGLTGVYAEDLSKDTLLYANTLSASFYPWKLLKNELRIKYIDAEDFVIKVSQETPDSDFNFQFLIDAFASDTTSEESSSMRIGINGITLKDGRIKYDVFSEQETPNEFNPSHIDITDLNANLSLPSLDPTRLEALLEALTLKEKSGLDVVNLKANITTKGPAFSVKDAELELPHSALKIPSAQYNLITSSFSLSSDRSTISPKDITPFMQELKYLRQDIDIETNINGKLPAINIDDIRMSYGDDTKLQGKAYIESYEDYGKSALKLDISDFQITPDAIEDFTKIGDSTFITPDILKTLGTIRLHGLAEGSLEDLNVNAEARAKHGALLLLAKASTDTTFENFSTNIKLQTQNFNVGTLLEMPEIGRLSAQVELSASQSDKQPLNADVKGIVHHLQYDNQDYENIPFTAYYNSEKMGAWLDANLPIGKITAQADMTQSNVPQINLDLNVEKLQLDKFTEFPDWKNPELSFYLNGKIIGTDLSKIQADVIVQNFNFSHDSLSFQPGTISLKAGLNEDPTRNYIQLNSSLLDANVTGIYDFATLSDEVFYMMNSYLPGLFPKTSRRAAGKNDFQFNLTVQNTKELGRILDLPVNVIDPLTFGGSINTINNVLKLNSNIPYLDVNDMAIRNTILNVSNNDSVITMTGDSRLALETGEDVSFRIDGSIQSDTIKTIFSAKHDNKNLGINGSFDFKAHFEYSNQNELISSVQFSPSTINIGAFELAFLPAHIRNKGNTTSISNFGFMEGKGQRANKYFGMDGTISDQPQDTLNISFFNSDIGNILKAFRIDHIETVANGNIRITNTLTQPEIYTNNMRLSDIIIFGDTLGELNIKSLWSNSEEAIKLRAILTNKDANSTVEGLVYPTQDSLNLRINIDRFPIGWTQPFMADMLNQISGSISTGLRAKGKISAPAISGWLGVNDAYIGVDYINVTYHVSDTIEISPDKIGFDNLIVLDPDKNKARVSALVTHQNFENLQYSLDMNFNDFMVLNTPSRTDSLFYGKLYASGTAKIKGTDDDIKMTMKVRNGKNSRINILVPQTLDANVYQSIIYINTPEDETEKNIDVQTETPLPLNIDADITLSPDLILGVIINPMTGDEMQVRGSGQIKFAYDMESEIMNAFGNYVLSDGFVKLKLQNIAAIEFKIKEGSKLVFNGDPMRTGFDVTAYKRVRADLRTLNASFGEDMNSSPRVYVDCILGIKGNMNKMDLTYDITLPDANDDVQQRVNSLIKTDDQKITQFAYLLATGSFHSEGASGTPGGNIAETMLTSVASNAISSGLNSVFGKIIGSNWQIGTNIESEDASFTNVDMTVSLSRKFMNDKLEFNTNLGYRTDQSTQNSFIGDFDVAYALSNSIKLKVFNKTNDRYYNQAPTTQGIGIVYTREAKTLKALFRSFRKRRAMNNNNRIEPTTTNFQK